MKPYDHKKIEKKWPTFVKATAGKQKEYNHKIIEPKWQKKWEKQKLNRASDTSKQPKFYALDMFPYPSGEGLHVGHPKGYIATDIVSRMKKMQGFNILHPMGFDAFGLPAENYAIKTKTNPQIAVKKNIKHYKDQLSVLGFNYDWSREINTTDPKYYKWTQWIFLQLLKQGNAYESYEEIDWCPKDKTGLAKEDIENGKCERCGTPIEKKLLKQWVLKITDYAERLLTDLDVKDKDGKYLIDWPESIKESQRNWIGKSEGSQIDFALNFIKDPSVNKNKGPDGKAAHISVFTTRADTLFGVTYLVLAPEHLWVKLATDDTHNVLENKEEVKKYIESIKNKTEIERTTDSKEKTGVELKGVKAINPVNGEEIPMFVADYVLANYGTGAVMAVPAHDERDFQFAKKYNLDIKPVIRAEDQTILLNNSDQHLINTLNKENAIYSPAMSAVSTGYKQQPTTGYGILMNSSKFDGLDSEKAKKEITEFAGGKMVTKYKLRDWVFSRQRYWGEPIPVIHCEKCGIVPVPEKDLPVLLPKVKYYEPTGTGESPLAAIEKWVNVKCPKCKGKAKRETNTMPQWAGSSWYYLRYIDPKNKKALVDPKKEKEMMPVDLYVGGAEHATRHLIYARFWHKFLFDIGVVSGVEPFKKLQSVGLILAKDGQKMSKRWGNVVNPDEVVSLYGADSLRLYEMFMGPFDQPIAWDTNNIIGVRRFLEKIWRLSEKIENKPADEVLETSLQKAIKKVSADIESMQFNTAVSTLMIFSNDLEKAAFVPKATYQTLLQLLAPFAPHIADELWSKLGHKKSIHIESWPQFDPTKVVESQMKIIIQINGKVRGDVTVAVNISEQDIKNMALGMDFVKKWVEGQEIKKVIYIKDRLINIVV